MCIRDRESFSKYLVTVDGDLIPPIISSCVVEVISNSTFSERSIKTLCLKNSISTVSASFTPFIIGGEVMKSKAVPKPFFRDGTPTDPLIKPMP